MPDLRAFGLTDMLTTSAALRRAGAGAQSMEETAEAVVHHLYDGLRGADGQRQCVLARFPGPCPWTRSTTTSGGRRKSRSAARG